MAEDDLNTFSIAFDTKSLPGKVVVTTVRLERRILSDASFSQRRFRINMVDHPLYRALVRYVLANPLRG